MPQTLSAGGRAEQLRAINSHVAQLSASRQGVKDMPALGAVNAMIQCAPPSPRHPPPPPPPRVGPVDSECAGPPPPLP